MSASDNMTTPFIRPKTIAELDAFLNQDKSEKVFVAGATDLMVQPSFYSSSACLVDLTGIPELASEINVERAGVRIGAAVPIADITSHPVIRQRFPILTEACRQIGSIQIQNRATLGGNLANASPAGDSLPVLDVLDAEIWLGPAVDATYEIHKLADLMLGPGQTCLTQGRYIASIFLPFPDADGLFWYFRKVGQRKVMAISKVSLAVLGWMKDGVLKGIRISPGSVSPQIKRACATEQMLVGHKLSDSILASARFSLMQEISPISDIRSTEVYRKEICGNLLVEALTTTHA
ncbi:MAG: FAD binding domain-containing protein [Candidatus Zhuqueibacterota bacterium]